MGYDMYWNSTPPAVEAKTAEIQTRLDAATADRNAGLITQEQADEIYEELERAQSTYFRLNIWGMGIARELMWNFGMAYDSNPDPALDVPTDEGFASDAYLESGTKDEPGIPIHKFCSNDGWNVTPLECLGAVSQWRKFCDQQGWPYDYAPLNDENEPIAFWPRWIEYLTNAADAGGFRVF